MSNSVTIFTGASQDTFLAKETPCLPSSIEQRTWADSTSSIARPARPAPRSCCCFMVSRAPAICFGI